MKGDLRPEEAMAAAIRRREISPSPLTNAYRVINGPGDNAPPGLTIDRYANWFIISARSSLDRHVIDSWIRIVRETFQPDGLIYKTIEPKAGNSHSTAIFGSNQPIVLIEEGDARFECRLNDGPQTGLFLDHRHTRWFARQFADGVEVLNLFAYTGSFSVHTALAGAQRVTSVDVSQKALQWGRRNMQYSGLNPDAHRWFADDVQDHLRRPRRSYGLVVLDPPVFGHGKRPFSLQRDLPQLVLGAIEQLHDKGILIISTHHLNFQHQHLHQILTRQTKELGLHMSEIRRLGLPPWDHPVPSDTYLSTDPNDRGQYLHTIVVQIHRK
ncbi:MAG: class I SAM-dependent methyltransferase [Myxococcales bacterium]|nr:class I SAM-dependent methyltransferase [Myxococcales bacterium]